MKKSDPLSLEHLKLIIDQLPIGLEIYDGDGNQLYINERDAEIFYVQDRSLTLGQGINFYNNPNIPAQNKEALRRGEDIDITMQFNVSNIAKTGYYDVKEDTGRDKVLTIRARTRTIRNADGSIRNYIFMLEDISEISKYQAELKDAIMQNQLILDNNTSGIVYLGTDYIVKWQNLSKVFPIICQTMYKVGKCCYKEFNNPEPCFGCPAKVSFETGEVHSRELFNADTGMTIKVTSVPVVEHGKIVAAVLRIDDETETKKNMQELIEAKQKAKQSEMMKSAFVANISHEIRTPLNAILGFSELIKDADTEQEKEEYYNLIDQNSQILLNLINDVLVFSKVESEMFEMKYADFDINTIYSELYDTMRDQVSKKSLELIKKVPVESCYIHSEPLRIRQVITNFITNAVKITEKGSITFGYDIMKDGVRFWVQDTGIGIKEEDFRLIFRRFVKLDEYRQGTGLGLSICKKISELLQGYIGVESEVGVGTIFYLKIPCDTSHYPKKITMDDSAFANKRVYIENHLNNEIQMLKILIVESDDDMFSQLSSLLSGQMISRATNGLFAAETVRTEKIDIIFIEKNLPDISGIEVVKLIRRYNNLIKIIAIVKDNSDSEKNLALSSGCNSYITTPVDVEQINKVLSPDKKRG